MTRYLLLFATGLFLSPPGSVGAQVLSRKTEDRPIRPWTELKVEEWPPSLVEAYRHAQLIHADPDFRLAALSEIGAALWQLGHGEQAAALMGDSGAEKRFAMFARWAKEGADPQMEGNLYTEAAKGISQVSLGERQRLLSELAVLAARRGEEEKVVRWLGELVDPDQTQLAMAGCVAEFLAAGLQPPTKELSEWLNYDLSKLSPLSYVFRAEGMVRLAEHVRSAGGAMDKGMFKQLCFDAIELCKSSRAHDEGPRLLACLALSRAGLVDEKVREERDRIEQDLRALPESADWRALQWVQLGELNRILEMEDEALECFGAAIDALSGIGNSLVVDSAMECADALLQLGEPEYADRALDLIELEIPSENTNLAHTAYARILAVNAKHRRSPNEDLQSRWTDLLGQSR